MPCLSSVARREAPAHVSGSNGSPLTQWNSSPTLRRPIQGSLRVNLNKNSCTKKEGSLIRRGPLTAGTSQTLSLEDRLPNYTPKVRRRVPECLALTLTAQQSPAMVPKGPGSGFLPLPGNPDSQEASVYPLSRLPGTNLNVKRDCPSTYILLGLSLRKGL